MMVERWADGVAKRMVSDHVIAREQEKLVAFGIAQGVQSVLEMLLLLLTGLLMQRLWESLVILAAFIPMRIYAGGYHAKTLLQCVVKSWLLFTGVLLWLKFVPEMLWLEVVLMVVAGIFIWKFAPLEDVHKPLEEYEVIKYKKRAEIGFVIESAVFLGGTYLKLGNLPYSISMAMVMLLVVMSAAVVRRN